MKTLILSGFLIFFIFSFNGCKKSDKRIQKKLVGKWEERSSVWSYSSYNSTRHIEFTADGKFIEYEYGGLHFGSMMPCDSVVYNPFYSVFVGVIPCTTEYILQDGVIDILFKVTDRSKDWTEYLRFEVTKVTNKELKLTYRGDGKEVIYKYLKQK